MISHSWKGQLRGRQNLQPGGLNHLECVLTGLFDQAAALARFACFLAKPTWLES